MIAIAVIVAAGGPIDTAPAALSAAPAFLVFTSDRDGDSDVYAATPDGTRVAALTRNGKRDTSIVLSPAGGWLALWRDYDATVLLSADGRTERVVGPGEPESFSPDGRLLAWARERDLDDPFHAVLSPVAGGDSRVLGLGVPGQFSPDGRLLEFFGDDFGFFEVASGARRVLLQEDELEGFDYFMLSPRWDRLALLTMEPDDPPYEQELLVYDLADGQRRTVARGDLYGMSWIDGDRIAFTRSVESDGTRVRQIAVADAAGGAEQIVAEGDLVGASWSPSAEYVAYLQTVGDQSSYVVEDVQSGRVQTVEPDGWSVEDLSWSPSGDRLAVSTARNGGAELTVLDPSGATPTVRLAGSYRWAWDLFWSPDESALAFRAGGRVVVASADGSASHVVMDAGNSLIVGWMKGTLPAQAPAAGPSPRPETAVRSELRSRGPVTEIGADGRWSAALLEGSPIDCTHAVAWKPGKQPVRFGIAAPCSSGPDEWLFGLSVKGTKVRWSSYYCGLNCYVDDALADALVPDTVDWSEDEYDPKHPPQRPRLPRETRKGVTMAVRDGRILLSRAGHVFRKIRPPGKLADAELETAGLFYAYNLKRGAFPGRVRFVPFSRLVRS